MIRAAYHRECYVSLVSAASGAVPGETEVHATTMGAPTTATIADELREAFRLTPREARVAMLLATRRTNREIAAELGVSEHTARRHTEKVLLKLDIHRRHDVQGALLQWRRRRIGDDEAPNLDTLVFWPCC